MRARKLTVPLPSTIFSVPSISEAMKLRHDVTGSARWWRARRERLYEPEPVARTIDARSSLSTSV